MNDRPTLFLVDDDPDVLELLRAVAKPLGLQSETYPSAEEFLAEFRNGQHGCLIIDVRMPGMSGLDLQSQLVAAGCSSHNRHNRARRRCHECPGDEGRCGHLS